MAIFNIFSKRQKKLRGEFSDVFLYDQIPQTLRTQIALIITDAFGQAKTFGRDYPLIAYDFICNSLRKEYGKFSLTDRVNDNSPVQIINFFMNTDNYEEALDVIEICFKYINITIRNDQSYLYYTNINTSPDEAIDELNYRFKENGVGYQFEENEIIRVDSTYVHSEIVKPTLSLLWNKKFSGANDEYLKAHEHYRHGRNKECLTECLKAFESTMKVICKEKGWVFDEAKDTSRKLIQICFQNNLIPQYTQNQFTSLQNLLESGIPTIRNRQSGHGQGQTPQIVDDSMTRYGLNLTGSNIIFLVEQSGIK
ncbi:hypothetical protein QQ054_02945 [Oscillatoria amoena NRMC-F 0135]|nr:hypothetical protein [Oscillatoria amoena NRMC-F 0135]